MIEHLKGVCIHRRSAGIVIEVGGVGYGVDLPLRLLCQMGHVGKELELCIYTHVREDGMRLFGFRTWAERELFEILLGVSGIGPKLALAIMSTLDGPQIRTATVQGISEVFESVPGIGARMAEKLLLELKAKLKRLNQLPMQENLSDTALVFAPESDVQDAGLIFHDVESALENLGFKAQAVKPTLTTLFTEQPSLGFHEALKESLMRLTRHDRTKSPAREL